MNRENDPDLRSWIDSEIKVMFTMQQPDGIIEGWHGDGNFARTALMYGLWKTQGGRLSPWKHPLRLGAVASEIESYLVITAQTNWGGKLLFDPIRCKTIHNLPVDYPGINQFPEWFIVDPMSSYLIMAPNSKLSGTYSGQNYWKESQ